jgi:exonuclease III
MIQTKKSIDALELNCGIEQMDLADIYRISHPTAAEYTCFSSAHGTFSRTDYILNH